MWELNNGHIFIHGFNSNDSRCEICGNYFQKGDNYYLIICNAIPEARERKLKNFMAHVDCWNHFCDGIDSNLLLAEKLKKHRKKSPVLTEDHKKAVAAFQDAAYQFGFHQLSQNSKTGIAKAKIPGSSLYLTYNPYTDFLFLHSQIRKKGLFDPFYEKEIVVRIRNAMNQILGIVETNDYSAKEEIQKVIDQTCKKISSLF